MKSSLARFLRSSIGLASISSAAALAVLLFVSGMVSAPAALVVFAASSCTAVLVLMQTKLGGKAVVAERSREREERDARILGGVAAARKRLSMLRIDDAEVSAALERLVYVSGKYLEAQVRGAERDPAAEDAVLGAIEAVDDHLRMEDAERSGRRFHGGTERAEEDRNGGGDALSERTTRVLNAASDEIERRLDLAAGGTKDGVSAADRSAAREEL